jgi:hypothetical protein
MKRLSAMELADVVRLPVMFESDESALPERVTLHLLSGRRIVIAAREDGCLDVVLEEA